jgi:hypothetical protein
MPGVDGAGAARVGAAARAGALPALEARDRLPPTSGESPRPVRPPASRRRPTSLAVITYGPHAVLCTCAHRLTSRLHVRADFVAAGQSPDRQGKADACASVVDELAAAFASGLDGKGLRWIR